jgi:hypothetical protein
MPDSSFTSPQKPERKVHPSSRAAASNVLPQSCRGHRRLGSENTPVTTPNTRSRRSQRDFCSEAAVHCDDSELETSHLADLAAIQLLGSCLTVSPEYITSDLQEAWLWQRPETRHGIGLGAFAAPYMISTLALHARHSTSSLDRFSSTAHHSTTQDQASWKSLWNCGLDGLQSSGSERSEGKQSKLATPSRPDSPTRSLWRRPGEQPALPNQNRKRYFRRKLYTSVVSNQDDDDDVQLQRCTGTVGESTPLLQSSNCRSLADVSQPPLVLASCPDLHRPFDMTQRRTSYEVCYCSSRHKGSQAD